MGLVYHLVEALLREHAYRPLDGDVVLIGRQGVYFTSQGILSFFREHGVNVTHISPSDIEIDRRTLTGRQSSLTAI